jgi:hypothetical protein
VAPQIGGVDLDRSAHTTGQRTAAEISYAIDLANACTASR